ncbi:glycosyltransferase family 2 protein [Shimia sp. FJ5]|uniref:glycosyltransferase family 2 protein n=1 Tax=Shimia sp. FJ5 TaxID=3079054 RepID=UPI0026142B43|nr:glycosyltransferase family A protein [Shimia sp. FJ5]MDV4144315.1 glycosyltransferase family A protein [Shimia sp. FJ5]
MRDLCVIIPAYDASNHLGRCIDALLADGFAPESITVVDDASTDQTGALAKERGVAVIRRERQGGPGVARNTGAAATQSEIILFVDSDVAVCRGTRAKILAAFAQEAAPDALFGSYDDAPSGPHLVSRYRNLLHHHTHQISAGKAETFWTGLGAVTRSMLAKLGGFDPKLRYLEDVEFGLRIGAAGGRIDLAPEIQGTHLKGWTLLSMFMTDWKGRAVPWARLLADGRIGMGRLNTSLKNRANALLVLLLLVSVVMSAFVSAAPLLFAALLIAFVAINQRFFRLLWSKGGPALALASIGFHAVHYIAALLGVAEVRLSKRRRQHASRAETSCSPRP